MTMKTGMSTPSARKSILLRTIVCDVGDRLAVETQSSVPDVDESRIRAGENGDGGSGEKDRGEGGERKKDRSPETSTERCEKEGTDEKLLRSIFEDLTLTATQSDPETVDSDQATDPRRNDERDTAPPDAATSSREEAATPASPALEERGELSYLYVGRIIGKGGEMIRDLQARSGCHIDVDQNVAPGEPRIVTYRGRSPEDIALARRLVDMLCNEPPGSGRHEELPLGRAIRAEVRVPERAVGRIIGRGGGTIRELQCRSCARVQVDHTHGDDGSEIKRTGDDDATRRVTITGTRDSVDAARGMIAALASGCDNGGGRGACPQLPSDASHGPASPGPMRSHVIVAEGGAYPHYLSEPYITGHFDNYQMPWDAYQYSPPIREIEAQLSDEHRHSTAIATEIIPCARRDIGRFIGRRGRTIHSLQRRSACHIQIDQGEECRIVIEGPRSGIQAARRMLREISEQWSDHPSAGRRGPRAEQAGYDVASDPHQQFRYTSDPRQPPLSPIGPSRPQQNQQPLFGYANRRQLRPEEYRHPSHYGMNQQYYGAAPAAAAAVAYPQRLQHPHNPSHRQRRHLTEGHPAPSPWRAATDAEGRVYYYNQETMETRWDRPADILGQGSNV